MARRIVGGACNGDKAFQNAVNGAFEAFLNLSPRAPEFLSLFMDERLRRGLKGASEDDVDATLDAAMVLFRFLQEKDLFEKYYKQHLAKRLLSGRTVRACMPGLVQKAPAVRILQNAESQRGVHQKSGGIDELCTQRQVSAIVGRGMTGVTAESACTIACQGNALLSGVSRSLGTVPALFVIVFTHLPRISASGARPGPTPGPHLCR